MYDGSGPFPEQPESGNGGDLWVPARKVRQLSRFRLGCQHLPIVVGWRSETPREPSMCQRCHCGLGGEHLGEHLIFECSSVDELRTV